MFCRRIFAQNGDDTLDVLIYEYRMPNKVKS